MDRKAHDTAGVDVICPASRAHLRAASKLVDRWEDIKDAAGTQVMPQWLIDAATSKPDRPWPRPTPIQSYSLPVICDGEFAKRPNVKAKAKNHTGKTGAFATAILSTVVEAEACVQAVVLTPTHTLAEMHVVDTFAPLTREVGIKVRALTGDKIKGQITEHVVIGKPNGIKRAVQRKNRSTPAKMDLSKVKIVVLDEADEMLDDSDTANVIAKCGTKANPPQILLFSATYDESMVKKSSAVLSNGRGDPVEVNVGYRDGDDERNDNITFFATAIKADKHLTGKEAADDVTTKKLRAVLTLLKLPGAVKGRTLIFCNTKREVELVGKTLAAWGIKAVTAHAGKPKTGADSNAAAKAALDSGDAMVGVCTDQWAKGTDIKHVGLVINFSVAPVWTTENNVSTKVADQLNTVKMISRSGRAARDTNSTDPDAIWYGACWSLYDITRKDSPEYHLYDQMTQNLGYQWDLDAHKLFQREVVKKGKKGKPDTTKLEPVPWSVASPDEFEALLGSSTDDGTASRLAKIVTDLKAAFEAPPKPPPTAAAAGATGGATGGAGGAGSA